MIKVKILKSHSRAEDCRTIHNFEKGQVIEANQEFAARILKDKMGEIIEVVIEEVKQEIANETIAIAEEPKVEEVESKTEGIEEKAIENAPEDKAIHAEKLENKSIFSAEEKSEILAEEVNSPVEKKSELISNTPKKRGKK